MHVQRVPTADSLTLTLTSYSYLNSALIQPENFIAPSAPSERLKAYQHLQAGGLTRIIWPHSNHMASLESYGLARRAHLDTALKGAFTLIQP